jgi:hypothetical protein
VDKLRSFLTMLYKYEPKLPWYCFRVPESVEFFTRNRKFHPPLGRRGLRKALSMLSLETDSDATHRLTVETDDGSLMIHTELCNGAMYEHGQRSTCRSKAHLLSHHNSILLLYARA